MNFWVTDSILSKGINSQVTSKLGDFLDVVVQTSAVKLGMAVTQEW